MRRTISAAVVLLLVCALFGHAQQPTFRAGVDLLRLDVVVVTDTDGAPVADLKAADFDIEIEGYVRPIRSLQFVEYAAAPVPAGMPTGPGAFSENTGAPGRLTVIVVDEAGLAEGQEHAFVESFSHFVAPVAPQDRVALISLPGKTARVDFTNDAEALRKAALNLRAWSAPVADREAINISRGESGPPESTMTAASPRADASRKPPSLSDEINPVLDTLIEIAKSLRNVDGQKTLVFVSTRLPGGQDNSARTGTSALRRPTHG